MDLVEKDVANALTNKIVRNFGDSDYRKDRYIFDQITRLPDHYIARRVPVSTLLASLDQVELFVILDPHPNNASCVKCLSNQFGFENELAYKVSVDEARLFFSYEDCDMYLLNVRGDLIAVGCHEDSFERGERIVWTPIPIAET